MLNYDHYLLHVHISLLYISITNKQAIMLELLAFKHLNSL